MATSGYSFSNVDAHFRLSAPAGSANLQQFQFVTLNSSGQLVTPSAGAAAFILDDAPSLANATLGTNGEWSGGYEVAGRAYGYVLLGVQKVIFGGAVAPMAQVSTDVNGHAVATTSGAQILGISLGAANSGDISAVLLGVSFPTHA
jgi:hypothetical protein